jgi:hypothetical protein
LMFIFGFSCIFFSITCFIFILLGDLFNI